MASLSICVMLCALSHLVREKLGVGCELDKVLRRHGKLLVARRALDLWRPRVVLVELLQN